LTAIFPEFRHHASYYKIPDLKTLGEFVGYRILWSGYQVQPDGCSTPYVQSLQGSAPSVGNTLASTANASTSPESNVGRQPAGPAVEKIVIPTSRSSHKGNKKAGRSGASVHEDGSTGALPYPERPLWRGKYCLLLNEDFSVHGRALIQVCLHEEPFDEDVLGDMDVGVMYVSENSNLQMTTMHWPLTHVRLEGGSMLSKIIFLCFENTISNMSNDGLDGMKKNPYHFNVWRKLLRSDDCTTTKLH
jgi:hypothetical protein